MGKSVSSEVKHPVFYLFSQPGNPVILRCSFCSEVLNICVLLFMLRRWLKCEAEIHYFACKSQRNPHNRVKCKLGHCTRLTWIVSVFVRIVSCTENLQPFISLVFFLHYLMTLLHLGRSVFDRIGGS